MVTQHFGNQFDRIEVDQPNQYSSSKTKTISKHPPTHSTKNQSKTSKFIFPNTTVPTGARAKLVPIEKCAYIYVSNLRPEHTPADVMEVLKELDSEATFSVEKPDNLNKKPSSSGFVIKAPSKFAKTLLDSEFWPCNTYVNKYFLPRKAENVRTVPVNQTNA